MRSILYSFLLLLCVMPLLADNAVALASLNRPSAIEADQYRLFIVEDTSILIYSLEDFKLLKKFGRKGQGPGEFNYITSIYLLTDSFLVNSRGKVSFFTKDGNLIKEIIRLALLLITDDIL